MYSQHNPYQMQPRDYWTSIKRFFNQKSVLSKLILINILVFVLLNSINLTLFLFSIDQEFVLANGVSRITYWLSLPADLSALAFKPWTLLTYMFVQEGILHLLFNMMVLYIGGQIFTNYLSEKKLLSTYIFGGLAGAFLFILSFNLFPAFSNHVANAIALGSSASVLAIFVASATRVPNLPLQLILFGRVPLKYIALAIIVLDVLNIRNGNAGGHIAHIGGALYGFFMIRQPNKGKHLDALFGKFSFGSFLNQFKKPKTKFKNVYTNPKPQKDEDYLRKKAEEQARIDVILDKIKKSGYESLSAEEKAKLFNASNRH
ncbi:MAG TPA: rhomboid family intramembrane serine protease [Bacteroidales bacterium]|nr:rhomboid family intramembrane serine protease [Bacteroidales bacterium]